MTVIPTMMNLTIRTLLALMLSWTVASREQSDFTCYRQAHAAYHQTLHKMPVHQMPPPTYLSAHEQAREAASSRKHHELLKQHHAEEATRASSRKHHKTTIHLTAAASGKHFRFSSESPTVAPHLAQVHKHLCRQSRSWPPVYIGYLASCKMVCFEFGRLHR